MKEILDSKKRNISLVLYIKLQRYEVISSQISHYLLQMCLDNWHQTIQVLPKLIKNFQKFCALSSLYSLKTLNGIPCVYGRRCFRHRDRFGMETTALHSFFAFWNIYVVDSALLLRQSLDYLEKWMFGNNNINDIKFLHKYYMKNVQYLFF